MKRYRKTPGAAVRGFTLIELLTVIAIIGILAAIIIPVTGSVRKKARATVAASNIRQLVNGQLAHALDNKGQFTPTQNYTKDGPNRSWLLRLAPYVLPSATDSAKLNAARSAGVTVFDVPEMTFDNVNNRTIAMNWVIQVNVNLPTSSNADYAIQKIPRPMSTIMLGEMVETGTDLLIPHDRGNGVNGTHTPGFRRDGDKALMGFYDGRVKGMTIEELAWTGKTKENNPWWWK